MTRISIALRIVPLMALLYIIPSCGDTASDAALGPPPSDDGGGANVGFGGAQDIGQFRSILQTGGIPGPNTLDAAGFFAEHYVQLPAPDCDGALCAHGMLAVGTDWLDSGYQATLGIALNTPSGPEREPDSRPAHDFVVVIDTSGSMNVDDRIGYVRAGLHLLVDSLTPEDRLAVVRYDGQVEVVSDFRDPAAGSPEGIDEDFLSWQADLHEQIDKISASGATNIHDGLALGFELASSMANTLPPPLDDAASAPARHQRVILLSDGVATAGITDSGTIIAMAEGFIETGIGLTTIGVGLDFNVDLMRGLAERGAGNFYFLEDVAAVEEVFTQELDYVAEPLALQVTVEVRTDDNYRMGEVLGTRLWRTEGDVGSIYLPAVFRASRTSSEPDDGGGRRGGGGTLFIDMLPTGALGNGSGNDPNHVAELSLRYRLPGDSTLRRQTVDIRSPGDPGSLPAENFYSHQAMVKQYAMHNLFLGLRAAAEHAYYGSYGCALSTLEELDRHAAAWNQDFADDDIIADRELISMFAGNLREAGAEPVPAGDVCDSVYDDDYYYEDDYYYDYDDDYHTCSAGGGSHGGAVLLLIAVLWAVRRRRRPTPH